MTRRLSSLAVLLVVVAAVGARAQSPNKPSKDSREEGKKLFGGSGESSAGQPGKPGSASASGWSIVLYAFRGEDQAAEAAAGLERARTLGKLPGAYMEKRGAATVIAYGKYHDNASSEAKADLAKVRAVTIEMEGVKRTPFAQAFLAPPERIPGTMPEFDLRNARQREGDWALYTLQVGVYARSDTKAPSASELAQFRKSAEEAAAKLRREGEQAYYYHGPSRSMVTIGLFGAEDFDPQVGPPSDAPALKSLRKRFPHNLLNGMGIREKKTITDPDGKKVAVTTMQPSTLVAVPKGE
ncbi:MAG: hypothetical protein JNM80_12165 [Phycisphaerae bacterium]|nr:hypothetical protein [Phycisphaerae bacterium]